VARGGTWTKNLPLGGVDEGGVCICGVPNHVKAMVCVTGGKS